jgi:hypothetical protein
MCIALLVALFINVYMYLCVYVCVRLCMDVFVCLLFYVFCGNVYLCISVLPHFHISTKT